MKMSMRRTKSPGWAAFDLKQRQKKVFVPEGEADSYPPMSSAIAPLQTCQNLVKNNDPSAKSFSSVLLPSANFPSLVNKDFGKPLSNSNSNEKHCNAVSEEYSVILACKKLREIHCWADRSLIEDIMKAVDNDIDKASTLLKEMVSSGSSEGNNRTVSGLKSNSKDFLCDNNLLRDKGVSLGESTSLAELSHVLEDCFNDKNKEPIHGHTSRVEKLSDDIECMKLTLQQLSSIPVEPDWEEDDIYLIHRKDALRMMRSASHHSRAATDAYLRGDHFSAQQSSIKARKEWLAAEKLNAKAAKEIISIRNCNNDTWKLDLHGLHAVEAVQALQEHLQKIESQVLLNRSVSPSRTNEKAGFVCSASLESLGCMDMEKLDTQQASSRQRPTSLHVITGIGNHSRGQAALPAAIRNFLDENGYRYHEARPGVITVRPKFRRQ
ncbi:uncharacterized protein LOC132267371 [Cornus florida]|uniref:uncharacterized protein LOC132267371 n=1 Tax=Cornus florida TaxID=4283 RepID=UPI00289C65A1|nr:uncharacterized protein LOC132267371 [Cornus florida]